MDAVLRQTEQARELFYLSPTGALMRVGVERGPSWTATTPSMVLKENDAYFRSPPGNFSQTYDISPDGRRFLIIKTAGAEARATPPSIVVVQNFGEELKAKVPVR